MSNLSKLYTVESVTSGHPDKVCDQISDAILDECLRQDPKSRVAIESFGSAGLIVVGGEITTNAKVDFESIARKVYRDIGYESNPKVIVNVSQQSPDIAQGVDTGGAGDQGIMYGYATSETPEFLPKGVVLAHKLTKGLEDLRKSGEIPWLRPDGKAQVTIEGGIMNNELGIRGGGNEELGIKQGKNKELGIENSGGRIRTILVSTQHADGVSQEEIRKTLIEKLINPILEQSNVNGQLSNVEVLINPTGKFVKGGFDADTGLTGRKIMVDTYGGLIQHGGGAFSGKDATKVDRSAAYMARFVAKNLVAQGHAKNCLVSVAYAIGRAEPLMVEAINEKGESLKSKVEKEYDFRPAAIIERLGLRNPIYFQTASYGHFGKAGLPWERIVEASS